MGCVGVKEFIPARPDQDATYLGPLDPPGLHWPFIHARSPGNYNGYFVPLWAPFLAAGGAAAAFWRIHYLRKFPVGACLSCGYDRRGIAGPCPECGASLTTLAI